MNKIMQIEPFFTEADCEAVLAVMESGFLTEGAKTREFEAEIAAFFGVPHAHAVNNATLALTIALQALGIGSGDEVIVPDFTFIATANAVSLAGATPVFADISRDCFVLDLDDVSRRITTRTRAIIPVHLNGRAPDMASLMDFAQDHHLAVVEDASQALGSKHHGRYLGTFGDAGIFSLGTTKIITSGQGGVVITCRREISEACRRIKDHGRLSRSAEVHDTLGFNSKFTDLQAALVLSQFRSLPERIVRKRDIFSFYRDRLSGLPGIFLPPMDLSQTVPWFADILCEDRDALETHLAASGIQTRRFYLPIHSQPCYARIPQQGGDGAEYPGTAYAARHGLWLPSSISLTAADLARIASEISDACAATAESASVLQPMSRIRQ